MNWNLGYTANYSLCRVDPDTWKDVERFKITGGSVSKTDTGLMESADVDLTTAISNDTWVRIYLDATQGQDGAHEALFTGLLSCPAVMWEGERDSYTAECYSVLKPAADLLLCRGWFAQKGRNGAELAAELLAGRAPVSYADNAPLLSSNIVAEDGESNLTMAQKLLEAIGWRIRITGLGEIQIVPNAEEAERTIGINEYDIVEKSLIVAKDMFSIPNVFRASANGESATVTDDDENSVLSTVNRGREIWAEESDCALSGSESVTMYAKRRLKELQQTAETVSYTRRYLPDTYPGDILTVRYPLQNINDDYKIKNQTIELGYGARTSEEAGRYISNATEKATEAGFAYLVTDDGYYLVDDEGNLLIALTEI